MADKTVSIKSATDKQLSELIDRLRKENELANLISDLKRKSGSGYMPYDYGLEISTEKAIESLYHFGILGMHWGRRKNKSSNITIANSEDHERKMKFKNKNTSQMSNLELKLLNDRMQLEKQYKELTKSDISLGKKFIKELVSSTAKQTATTYVSKYAAKGIDALVKKAAR